MRKLVVSIHSTANDIVTGSPSGDETELVWAEEGITDSLESFERSLSGADTFLLGRNTYEDLVRRWPKVDEWPEVTDLVRRLADKINTTPKIVVTNEHPLDTLDWGSFDPVTEFNGPDAETEIARLKAADGGDIVSFGSPTLVQSLTNAGLVDEYRILVHPVIVPDGGRLFTNLTGRTDLRLLDLERFEHGALMLTYAPAT